jgi:hypothetical protein
MTKLIRIRLNSRSVAIDLPDHDAGDLEAVDKALLGLDAKKIWSFSDLFEERGRYRLGDFDVILDWDGYTSALRTTDTLQLVPLFELLSQSPTFEVAREG